MDAVTNFGYGTILTAPSPTISGTSLVLNSGEGDRFPQPSTDGGFNLVISPAGGQVLNSNSEIVRVTARSGDTFTIVRGQEGTSAVAIDVGYQVALTRTAKFNEDLDNALLDQSSATGEVADDLSDHIGDSDNPHSVTKTQVGLGNVSNDAQIPLSQKGAVSGVAELDTGGKVPTSQLPAYVDDVLEYADLASFPATGEDGKIYIALDTNITYRWSGSAYVVIGSSLALGETSSTAYRGDRGKSAYDHSVLILGNPHAVTLSQAMASEGLVDPNADRIAFWDDSAGVWQWLTASTGLTLSGTTLTVRTATTSLTGIVELATDTEFTTGTDATRYVNAKQIASIAQSMSNKTLVSPILNTGVSGTAVLDEDNMASDSATKLATQQSIKKYVDNYFGSNSFNIDQSGGTSDTFGSLSGSINGSNAVFEVSDADGYVSGSLQVFLNGQLQTQGSAEDYVETSASAGTFTFATAPQTGDEITVAYKSATATSGNADTLDGLEGSAYVTKTGTETLTNKTLTNPTINFTDKASSINVKMRARLASDQNNLVSDTATLVALDTEDYDTGNDFNTTTSKFVVPVTGWYDIKGSVYFKNTVANKQYITYVYVDGSTAIIGVGHTGLADTKSILACDTLYLTAGQEVQLYAKSVAGVDTVDISNYFGATYLSIHLLSI